MNKLKAHIKTIMLMSGFLLMGFGWMKLLLFADTLVNGADVWVAIAPGVIMLYVFLYFMMREKASETK